MAKKAILTIDVNDEKFKKFHDLFSKYQDELDKQPEKWDALNKAMVAGVGAVVEQTHGIVKYLKEATHAQQQFHTATRKSGGVLRGMLKDTQSISRELFGISRFMLKTAGWGLGLGAAGIFGLDRIASDAIQTQRSARGLGLNTGQLRAWNINFGRYIGSGTLSTIATQKGTAEGSAMLSVASGLPVEQVANMSATSLDYRIATRLRKMGKTWNPAVYGQMMQAEGFTQAGFTVEDLRRLLLTRGSSLREARAAYERDKMTDRTGRAAVHHLFAFQRELQQTGKMLGTDLQRRLSALGPSMGGFIKALGADAATLINGVLSKHNLAEVQKGIQSFTRFLVSGEAKADIEKFASAMGHLAAGAEAAAAKLEKIGGKAHHWWDIFTGFLHDTGTTLGGDVFNLTHSGHKGVWAPVTRNGKPVPGYKIIEDTAKRWWYDLTPHNHINYKIAHHNAMRYSGLIGAATAKYHLPPGLLLALIETESSGLPGARSKAGAMGLTQLMPGTARGLGVTDPYDPAQNISAGAHYLSNMLADAKRMLPHGTLKQREALALSMYNAGPGTLNDDIRKATSKYGRGWLKHLPDYFASETASYAPSVFTAMRYNMRDRARQPAINVHVSNTTSSRVAISANAAAH